MKKSLKEMAAEIEQTNRAKGWYDDDRTFGEMVALLHSEVSEALEAYRHWGFDDATKYFTLGDRGPVKTVNPKPEGVGSEFADILIRLLDDAARLDIDLDSAVADSAGVFGISGTFGDQMTVLHLLISFVHMAYDESFKTFDETPKAMAKVYRYLVQLSDFHGIDLDAEYERKHAYNRTRPYRHGNKRL